MQAEPLPDRLIAEAALLRARGAAESKSDGLHRASETVSVGGSLSILPSEILNTSRTCATAPEKTRKAGFY